MPKDTKYQRTAPKRRTRVKRRVARRKSLRQSGSASPAPAAFIADSIYSLKLKPKSGPEVFFSLNGKDLDIDDAETIFNDLWKAYMRLHYLVKGEKTDFNPLAAGLSMPTVLHLLITNIKTLIPAAFNFNIDRRDNGDYHFTIFKYCEGWGRWFHALNVGHAILVLAKKNKPLHDLFLSFLREFSQSIGIPLWDQGLMGNTLESMDDRILNLAEEFEPEELKMYQEDIDFYQSGVGAAYARRIRSAKRMKASQIRQQAMRYRSAVANPIANLIVQGCEILLSPYRLYDYYYMDECEQDGCYVELDCQVNIIWSRDDNLFYEHEGNLDAYANEGIQEPAMSIVISKDLKKFDPEEIKKKLAWPGELDKFFYRAYEITEKFKKDEPIDGNVDQKSRRPAAHCSLLC